MQPYQQYYQHQPQPQPPQHQMPAGYPAPPMAPPMAPPVAQPPAQPAPAPQPFNNQQNAYGHYPSPPQQQLHQPPQQLQQPPQQLQQPPQQQHQLQQPMQQPPQQFQQPPQLQQPLQQPMQQPPQHFPPPGQPFNYQQNNFGHYPSAPQPQRQMKLDQHAMPSAAQLINDEIVTYKNAGRELKFTAPASLPPLVTTLESQQLNMTLQDGGCVRPCHMRSTIYLVPLSKDILDSSGLEFSVVIKPFDEGEIDGRFIVPLSSNEIVRCNRCKAYMNPFSKTGQCCICNFNTQGIQEFDQRPELHLGSYEFRVTAEYYRDQIAATRRPHIIFAIEMTANSRHLVHYLSKNLASVIKSHFPVDFLYSSYSPLVGFITYNSKITLYDVMNGGHAYIVSDMTSVTECASLSKFLVDPQENFEEIEKFLGSLVEISNEHMGEQQTVLGPVIEAAFKTCASDTSNSYLSQQTKSSEKKAIPTGKLYLLHASLPTYGDDTTPGRLGMKRNIDELKRSLGTENESKVLSPEGKYYTQLAQKCINDYASGIELFLFPPHPRAFMNVATLGELTRLTGTGIINKYHMSSLDNFIQDLKVSLNSTVAFDASMRVRTSTGISPVRYIGNFNNIAGSNLEMSAVNTNSNFIVQMKYDDKLTENDLVVVQFAMIYTSICGERRVRVHNLALSTTQNLSDLYKSACCDTLVNTLTRDTIDKMRSGSLSPKVAKEQLTSRVVNILAAYRKHCTDNQSSNSSQLILPEGLKLLPVYLCGALKCDAIDGGIEMFPDDKVLAQLNLLGSLPSLSQVTIYPRMFAINSAQENGHQEHNESGLGYTANLTRCYNLAIEEETGQCYVLENGYYLFIFFPNTDAGKKFLSCVYGMRQDDPDIGWDLRQRDTNESKFLEELINRISTERRRALKISVVRQARDKMEQVFKTFLYEDKKRPDAIAAPKWDNASYVDILCYLHAEIRAKLSQ